MSYKITASPHFDRAVKNLQKRHKSLKRDLLNLIDLLEETPKQGVALKNSCYKIRLAISSKNKGKSGGARVITYILATQERVILLDIYDKSDRESISDHELDELINNIPDDLSE